LNEHNTVFGSKAICAQPVYFLHSTMPSVTCLRLSDVSVICRVTYLQFPIGEIVRYLVDKKPTKFRLPLKLSSLFGSRPKSARASAQQCTQSAPDFIQIGSLSAEL